MKQAFFILGVFLICSCQPVTDAESRARAAVDTVGFATRSWQMDSVVSRIERQFSFTLDSLEQLAGMDDNTSWRVAISPHDDYAYAGPLYPLAIQPVKARTVFLFGVAHKARALGLEDRIVFDSFPYWETPYGKKKIPPVREELVRLLPADYVIVSDSMHALEHSLEALVPFLLHYNPDVEFVPVLVPYMSYGRMDTIASALAKAMIQLANQKGWVWGSDYAVLISNDAVHYGDEDWGGRSYARFGADSAGYVQAVNYEKEILSSCLVGELSPEKVKTFTQYTVEEADYHEYKWTWCGRYAVPFGLLTSWHLQQNLQARPLEGITLAYMTSIDHPKLLVEDLGMGVTAPANIRHWVGYAAVGYP